METRLVSSLYIQVLKIWKRPHSLSVLPYPVPCCLDCELVFPYIWSGFMFIASLPHHAMLWEPGSVFLMTFLQVLQGSYPVFPKLCLLLRLSKAFLCCTCQHPAGCCTIICTPPCLFVGLSRDYRSSQLQDGKWCCCHKAQRLFASEEAQSKSGLC